MKIKSNQITHLTAIFFIIFIVTGCATKYDLTKAPNDENIQYYEKFMIENAPSRDAFIALQRTTEPLLISRNYDKVASIYQKYDSLFATIELTKTINTIFSILEAEEEELVITNLAFSVNTTADEIAPVLSLDEKILFFTGRNRVGGTESEDIFFSELKNNQWQTAQNIGGKINTKRKSESVDAVSPDGTKLFLMGNFSDGYGKGDIYSYELTDEGWGNLEHLSGGINTKHFEANAFITADGKALFFTSDRPGGVGEYNPKGMLFNGGYIGNTDIYVCEKTPFGWGKPINLGSVINTPYAEYSPYLHPDDKTLYFSSDGHAGLGRLDVFKAVRTNNNSWTEWTEPVNLGKDINTPKDDMGYRISLSGDFAYFATRGKKDTYGSFGGYDIYTITLPEKVKPNPVSIVRGVIVDEKGNPLYADMKWSEKATGIVVSEIKSDPVDGSFMVVLKPQTEYAYDVKKKGFYTVSNSISTKEQTKKDTLVSLNIRMLSFEEIKVKKIAITINNIFFQFNKYKLLPESYAELNKLAKLLIENPEQNVEISGHTDNVGTMQYNQELSEKRAQAVVEYLIAKGCDKNKLTAKGFGFSDPIATNDTEEGRSLNRRVEFRIK